MSFRKELEFGSEPGDELQFTRISFVHIYLASIHDWKQELVGLNKSMVLMILLGQL